MALPRAPAAGCGLLVCAAVAGVSGSTASSADQGPRSTVLEADSSNAGRAHTARRRLRLVRVGTFRRPVYVTAPPGDRSRLFVVEQRGTIRVLRRRRLLRRPFLDIRKDVVSGGEQGLLSMAFAPDYARSGRFYVYYTDRQGDIRVEELRRSAASPNRADSGTRREVVFQEHSRFPNHNGGQLAFGPDGLLYIGVGDGGSEGDPFDRGQDLGTLLGKLLRIDPRPAAGRPYTVPSENPFGGRPAAREEIYSYGLRNPWRFSFDRRRGDLAIGDVGQDRVEEIDFERRGRARGVNFGWKRFEGRRRYSAGSCSGCVPPVIQRFHTAGWCAIVGGYVVRDRSLGRLYGRYVYGDDCNPRLRSARLETGRAVRDRPLPLRVRALSSFGEDAAARVYAASLRGPVYRLALR